MSEISLDGIPEWLMGRNSMHVSGMLPQGFEAYLRILHPAAGPSLGEEELPRPVTWSDIAAGTGIALQPETTWRELAGGPWDNVDVPGMGTVHPPAEGRLDQSSMIQLGKYLGETADKSTPIIAGFWDGWEPLANNASAPVEGVTRLEGSYSVNQGQYLFYTFSPESLSTAQWMDSVEFGWAEGNGITPSFLFPLNRAWCFATDLDQNSSLLGGPRSLVDPLLELNQLEALAIDQDADLSI
ncbi:hypothetical protein [Mycetocola saprophilus]|uniref:hypothetical protein n=1 Tax=Mycetocola saprophilus TaxID=76636 RepID=UPI003BF01DF0